MTQGRKRKSGRKGKARRDGYEVIASRILEMLENGVAPWRKQWVSLQPQSVRGHYYRGINSLILGLANYSDPRWITYRQAEKSGGHVRRGERGMQVIFWQWLEREQEDGQERRRFPLVRLYTVFNVEQCEGLELPPIEIDATAKDPIVAAEAVARAYLEESVSPPQLRHSPSAAPAYAPSLDAIMLPPMEQFASAEAYYATLFHEIGHSTGHASRLNRPKGNPFGSHEYGREELVAEFCAAYLCAEAGISPEGQTQTASYIGSWVKTIKADHKIVVQAAASAQRAADLVLGREFDTKELPAAA